MTGPSITYIAGMRKLLALLVLLFGVLLAAEPLLASPACGDCCDLDCKAMVQCVGMNCQPCAASACATATQPPAAAMPAAKAAPIKNETPPTAPVTEIWTPPD